MRDDKGKRMGLRKAAGSGPFRCFLRHRGKNAAIFGGGRSEVLLNTATEALNEERMNASGRLAVCRLCLEITRAAKISQGHGFHQETRTRNGLFRNKEKKKKIRTTDYSVWSQSFEVSAGSRMRKEIWQVDFKRRHAFLLPCTYY